MQNPDKYSCDAPSQLSFAEAIDRCTLAKIVVIAPHVKYWVLKKTRFFESRFATDKNALKTQPYLIARILGCGTIGGLVVNQVATQVALAMALATFTTPADCFGGAETAIFYSNRDKQIQKGKNFAKFNCEY